MCSVYAVRCTYYISRVTIIRLFAAKRAPRVSFFSSIPCGRWRAHRHCLQFNASSVIFEHLQLFPFGLRCGRRFSFIRRVYVFWPNIWFEAPLVISERMLRHRTIQLNRGDNPFSFKSHLQSSTLHSNKSNERRAVVHFSVHVHLNGHESSWK